jgi:hypothetical protein
LVGANSPLRVGPDRTLFCLVGMPARPGGELGWMPVATAEGRPIAEPAQRARTHWPFQPAPRHLRLVAETHSADSTRPPREARFALFDRKGRVVRAWRILSRTPINFDFFTPEFVGSDPIVSLDVTKQTRTRFRLEYLILRLGPRGVRTRVSLTRTVYGDNLLADLRLGPDGRLYQLGSSPDSGVVVTTYSLAPKR